MGKQLYEFIPENEQAKLESCLLQTGIDQKKEEPVIQVNPSVYSTDSVFEPPITSENITAISNLNYGVNDCVSVCEVQSILDSESVKSANVIQTDNLMPPTDLQANSICTIQTPGYGPCTQESIPVGSANLGSANLAFSGTTCTIPNSAEASLHFDFLSNTTHESPPTNLEYDYAHSATLNQISDSSAVAGNFVDSNLYQESNAVTPSDAGSCFYPPNMSSSTVQFDGHIGNVDFTSDFSNNARNDSSGYMHSQAQIVQGRP